MVKRISTSLLFIFAIGIVNAQHLGLTFQEAENQGIRITHLDSIYKSAVHADTSLAVFKADAEQQAMSEAYIKLLQDLGKFLTENNFKWENPVSCFNRIYFSPDGSIDYFLYNFLNKNVKTGEALSQEKQIAFNHLLNLFIKDYKISLTAKERFAQCSPTRYLPQK